ncbi:MAG: radical SAM protein [Rhodospirillum sp.]|nr:radical SAM protein [Rhodospirillum sp.]MCF8491911.1 radical SAM protein [Rhodospirillum sp.]MCF8502282.1 radical SAM protein [Rhodospirillum sp.]
MPLDIPYLEMDIAHLCNLQCQGCMHYSNYTLPGIIPFERGGSWLREWAERVRPSEFTLLGGEPLLNPEVGRYVDQAARLWPEAKRLLVSNGLRLAQNAALLDILSATDTILRITIHRDDAAYLDKLEPHVRLALEARDAGRIRLELIRSDSYWYKTYRGEGEAMRPFTDGDSHASWSSCFNKLCKTLRDGALWKCPPLAFLPLAAEKLNLTAVRDWDPYLAYRPLPLDAEDDALLRFFVEEDVPACAMCPAKLEGTQFRPEVTGGGILPRTQAEASLDLRHWLATIGDRTQRG